MKLYNLNQRKRIVTLPNITPEMAFSASKTCSQHIIH